VTVVGVAPAGFEGVTVAEHPDIYLPLEFQAVLYGQPTKHDAGRLWLDSFARLNPGVNRAEAQAEMNAIFPSILDLTVPPAMPHLPGVENAHVVVKPARTGWSRLRSIYTEPLLLLQLMVATVLFICCANLSGFLHLDTTFQGVTRSVLPEAKPLRGCLPAPKLIRISQSVFADPLSSGSARMCSVHPHQKFGGQSQSKRYGDSLARK
jgi:hypothetical protein